MHFSIKLTSFKAKTFVNKTGSPAEHASSIAFTEIANNITPNIAKIKLFSDVYFFILDIIFFLLELSTTSQPASFLTIDFINPFKFMNAPISAIKPITDTLCDRCSA